MAAPAVVCTLIVPVLEPGRNGLAFILFLALGPIAFIAVLVAAIRGPTSG
jgi:hypothetical protein